MSDYEVEKLLQSRMRDGKKEFKVKWKGFPLSDCTWEPLKNISHLKKEIKELEQKE
jgi:hypothetical protein